MGKVRNWMATVFPESAADAEPVAFNPTSFSRDDRIANFAFEGGKMLSLPLPDTHDPVTKRALRGLRAAQEADALAHAINHDENLSPIGKQRKLARDLAAPLGIVLKQAGALSERRKALKARIESAYAVGDPTDAERVEDSETRQAVRALPEAERRALLAELVGGKRPAVARALLRSPVPVPGFSEAILEQAWQASVETANPEVAEAKEIDDELAEAERTVRRAADIAVRSIGPDMLRTALQAQGIADAGPFNLAITHGFQPDPPALPTTGPDDPIANATATAPVTDVASVTDIATARAAK